AIDTPCMPIVASNKDARPLPQQRGGVLHACASANAADAFGVEDYLIDPHVEFVGNRVSLVKPPAHPDGFELRQQVGFVLNAAVDVCGGEQGGMLDPIP